VDNLLRLTEYFSNFSSLQCLAFLINRTAPRLFSSPQRITTWRRSSCCASMAPMWTWQMRQACNYSPHMFWLGSHLFSSSFYIIWDLPCWMIDKELQICSQHTFTNLGHSNLTWFDENKSTWPHLETCVFNKKRWKFDIGIGPASWFHWETMNMLIV